MNDDWLEIADNNIDVEKIMTEIRQRLGRQSQVSVEDPVRVADELRKEIIGDVNAPLMANRIPIRPQDCDIIPRNYKIEWRLPVVGHIHALVRRVIDNEIRLFLFPSLAKQVRYNRRTLWVLRSLIEENARLRNDLEALREEIKKLKS